MTFDEYGLCEACGRPDPSDAIAAQQKAMKPRTNREGRVMVTRSDWFTAIFQYEQPDIRIGDIVRVELIAGAVPDVTADFYCECA